MALIWPKHGSNMVPLIEHNIDMSIGPISLSPESSILLFGLHESPVKILAISGIYF